MFLENVSENDADAAFLSGSALEAGSKRTRKKRGRSSTSWSGKLISALKKRRRDQNCRIFSADDAFSNIRWLPDRVMPRAISSMRRQLTAESESCLPFWRH